MTLVYFQSVVLSFGILQSCKDWAEREAPIMRCAVVHALDLAKRTPNAKCEVIAQLKKFILALIQSGFGLSEKKTHMGLRQKHIRIFDIPYYLI